MAYTTFANVKAIVDTDMTDPEITILINRTDVRIDLTIGTGGVNALLLEDLSTSWTAYRVMLKDPNARGLGEYNERRDVTMRLLKEEVDDMLDLASGGGIAFTTASEALN